MQRSNRLIICCLSLAVWGCGSDEEARFDERVREEWMANTERVDALQFFREGGHFWNIGAPDESPIDREVVVPLVEALQKDAGVRPEILRWPDEKEMGLALLVPLPSEQAARDKVQAVLDETDESFTGMIIQQWGHEWIALDFLEEKQAALLNERGVPGE